MFLYFHFTGQHPWLATRQNILLPFSQYLLDFINTWGIIAITLLIGFIEVRVERQDHHWSNNDKLFDLSCYILPTLLLRPVFAWFSIQLLPFTFPGLQNQLIWITFG